MAKIAVLGAGAVGLSTAINIQRSIPNAVVTLIADKFGNETTSSGAGGIFKPTVELTPGVPIDLLKRWVSDSWKWFSTLTLSDKASTSGNQMVAGYYFCNKEVINPLYKDYVFSFNQMSTEELQRLNMADRYRLHLLFTTSQDHTGCSHVLFYKSTKLCHHSMRHMYILYGYHITTVITCVKDYLPWLTKLYLDGGGIIEGRRLENVNELVGKYDVVVNCTGLGSRRLFNDDKIHAVRGQLIKVQADWIKYWMYTDDGAYVLPNGDIVTIGGVRQKDDYNLELNGADRDEIRTKCLKLWPPLKGAKIAGEWVGLRPSRTPLRLEAEIMNLPNGQLKVVHNYGHGGVGIALSWGTSVHATQLVNDLLNSNSRL